MGGGLFPLAVSIPLHPSPSLSIPFYSPLPLVHKDCVGLFFPLTPALPYASVFLAKSLTSRLTSSLTSRQIFAIVFCMS